MNEEYGSESCPICGEINNPGACEVCKHYFGVFSDGEVIWSERFDVFSEAWNRLSLVCFDYLKSNGGKPNGVCQKGYRDAIALILGTDPTNCTASKGVMTLLDLRHGPTVETDGMLSSRGYSLYLANPTRLEELVARIEDVRRRIADLCSSK